ncbi:MAG: hypothetical protein KGI54_04510 [Pseudomonadota bacterium]|nr:hypothetical protein [Pseudomonadota bacterium]
MAVSRRLTALRGPAQRRKRSLSGWDARATENMFTNPGKPDTRAARLTPAWRKTGFVSIWQGKGAGSCSGVTLPLGLDLKSLISRSWMLYNALF